MGIDECMLLIGHPSKVYSIPLKYLSSERRPPSHKMQIFNSTCAVFQFWGPVTLALELSTSENRLTVTPLELLTMDYLCQYNSKTKAHWQYIFSRSIFLT